MAQAKAACPHPHESDRICFRCRVIQVRVDRGGQSQGPKRLRAIVDYSQVSVPTVPQSAGLFPTGYILGLDLSYIGVFPSSPLAFLFPGSHPSGGC
jgi:hypothetical protein